MAMNYCAELAELAELAADLLADARSLRDRVTELENDGMEIRAIVDAADQLHSTAAAAARALAAVADDFNDWGERWVPR
jgi:DNA-binding HxlR family transcriptional regulator